MSTPTAPADHKEDLSRRDFLRRLGYAAAVTLAAGGLGLWRHEAQGPQSPRPKQVLSGLGDFSLPHLRGEAGRLAVVEGLDRRQTVARGLEALGGMETFIQAGDRVLIKVNAAFATPPTLGATTHPELLTAVAKHCFQAGASQVFVTDNPINDPLTCFRISGLEAAAKEAGARLLLPRPALFQPVSLPSGRLLQQWPTLAGVFAGVNKVILLSPVKDHQRAGASLTLKNIYGFLGGRRNIFHQDINGIITELALLLKPTLCVLDGTVAMVTNGPTGGSLSDLKETGIMVISTDPVAADAMGVEILGRRLDDIPYIRLAAAAGAGLADYGRLHPLVLRL
ncbi:MAG: DUF362 domain-containing protein [Desulfobacca sp.]|uniref:DUF362 domain-containing protein n=1 Tax=Desulfobacca sp. TaxID=2067990 RepID=UPI00404A325E